MPSLIKSQILRYPKNTEKIAGIKNSQPNLGIRPENNATTSINPLVISIKALINTIIKLKRRYSHSNNL